MALENVQDIYPVSPMQAGMLFHTIESPDPGLYVLQIRVTLDGPLQWDVLTAAWDDVVHRHDALRAAFVWEELDEPLQVIQERVATPWERLDARRLVAEGGPGALDAWMEDDRRRGFDLKEAPLMRVTLLQLDDQRHRLVWTLHHLLADAWSVGVVLDELKGAYHARLGGHPFAAAPPPAYRDFIAWMKDRPDGDAEAAWRRSLEGFRERISVDLPRPTAREAGPRKRRFHEARLPPSAADALARAARACRVTPATLYQTAWARVLGDYASTNDVVFGLVVSGRSSDLPGAERAVGLYMNTVPARVRLAGSPTLRALVHDRHAESLALRPHENAPLGRIQAWSELSAGSPLFDTLLIVENHPAPSGGAGRDVLAFRDVDPMDQSNYPLAGFVIPGGGLRLLVLFDPEAVAADAAERLLGQFVTALEALPSHLDAPAASLPVLSPPERDQLETWAHGPALADGEPPPVHEQIAERARERPEATALVCGDRSLTYGEMEARASSWARRLASQGVGRGDRVALLVDRGCEMVVAMLASLKAGAAYVPFDTSYPVPRIGQVLDDCQPRVILASRAHEGLAARRTIPTLFLDDEAEGSPGELPECGRPRPRLRHVHLGLDWASQGRRDHPRQPRLVHGGAPRRLRVSRRPPSSSCPRSPSTAPWPDSTGPWPGEGRWSSASRVWRATSSGSARASRATVSPTPCACRRCGRWSWTSSPGTVSPRCARWSSPARPFPSGSWAATGPSSPACPSSTSTAPPKRACGARCATSPLSPTTRPRPSDGPFPGRRSAC